MKPKLIVLAAVTLRRGSKARGDAQRKVREGRRKEELRRRGR